MTFKLANIQCSASVAYRSSLGAVCCALLVCAGPATAQQSSEATVLEEVVVTASKRGDAALQDTAITVQALSGDELRDRLVSEVLDIADSVPGLQMQDRGPGDREYILRGINSSGDSTVGVYFDEAVITASNAEDGGGRNAPIKLYDLERVEVLKGPQGTLYGANSMAGTIRFVTNKPKLDRTESYLEGRFSTTEDGGFNYILNGMTNIPLIEDELGLRLVAWLHDMDGYVDQIRIQSGPIPNVNTEEVEGIRAHLRWVPRDDLTFTFSQTYQTLDTGGTSRIMEGPSNDLTIIDIPSANAGPLDNLNNTGLTQDPWEDEFSITSLTVDWEQDFGTLTATTNYFTRDIVFRFDNTGVLAAVPFFAQFFPEPFQGIQPVSRDIWSSEVRFASSLEDSPVQFVVGGFFQSEDQRWEAQAINVTDNGLPAGPFVPGTADDVVNEGGNTVFGRVDETEVSQAALFGEVSYAVTDQFEFLVGGRWFRSDFDSVEFVTHPFGFTDVVPFATNTNSGDLDEFTWRVTGSWSPEMAERDLLFYTTVSTGARRGGLNNASLPLEQFAVPEAFDPDELTNYEFGLKSTLLGGRMQTNLALYHMLWEELQLEGIDELGVVNFIGNFGEAEVNGVEFDLTWQATDRFWLFAGLAYQDAELTEDTPVISPNAPRGLDGDSIPNVPEWQGNLSAEYQWPVFDGWQARARVDLAYRDSTQTEFNDEIPANILLDSYSTVDAVFSLLNDNNGLRLDLFVDNLTDERAEIDAVTSAVDQVAYLTNRPRTYGISVSKRF